MTEPAHALRCANAIDSAAIRALHEAAFGQLAEADLAEALVDGGFAEKSLVAVDGSQIAGHVLLSRLASPPRSLALAPLAVLPSHQKQGVRHALVRAAIARAKTEDWSAIFVLGDPAYYTRFGFSVAAARPCPCPYAGEHFVALLLTDPPLASAPVAYPPPFAALV